MNIYILDPDSLDRVAILNNYSARNWNPIWGEGGSFKIWVPVTEENEEFLVEENLVWPDNQLLVGVIERIYKYTSEESGLALMEVSGRFAVEAYLSRRIIWGNELITNTPSSIIKSIVESQSVRSLDSNRRFIGVRSRVIVDSSVTGEDSITYCNSYGNLWEEVKGLSIENGLNIAFVYDIARSTTKMCPIIYMGQDKSSDVNLSTDLGFLTKSNYVWDSTDYCNTALIAGEGEGSERITTSIIPVSAVGRSRRELYVDARDLQKTSASSETPMSDQEYESALNQRGQKSLADYPLYESYECNLQLTGEEGYVFGQDYNLGDIVTLTDHILKIQVQARVKEHQMSEDRDGRTDTLVFGISIPTITSLVKRRG